ncbi:MAG: GAF domain-containing protein, partial [Chloroflexi bacterium]|nr:GAF domain-containing protein [Chloroflexota bacterium]
MDEGERLKAENQALRTRIAGLTEAILRMNEALDVDAVLQEVVDGARSLTGARYGAVTTIDEAGEFQHLVVSGVTEEEQRGMLETPNGWGIFRHLSGLREPLRARDCVEHLASAGFPGLQPPIGAFLGLQIREGERHVGHICLGMEPGGQEFTEADEETL